MTCKYQIYYALQHFCSQFYNTIIKNINKDINKDQVQVFCSLKKKKKISENSFHIKNFSFQMKCQTK